MTEQVTAFSNHPYFDDFDAKNNYYRILFRPGFSVQTRELNQLQTILQNQIGNLASYSLSDKSVVKGGEIKFNQSIDYIKLAAGSTLSRVPQEYSYGVKFRTTGGITGEIKFVTDADESGPVTLYVRYLAADELTGEHKPQKDDNITLIFEDGNTEMFTVSSSESYVGQGTVAELVEDSIYYIKKTLVEVPKQALIIERYNTKKVESVNVGILINERVVTAGEDIALYDNALGTPNEMAPGAHRYQITGILAEKSTIPESQIENFIELSRMDYPLEDLVTNDEPVIDPETGEEIINEDDKLSEEKNGVVAQKPKDNVANPVIPLLQQILAQRTFEESGDYIVNSFDLDIREHLKLASNGGLFTSNDGGKEELLVVQLDPGVAYIRGHRVSFDKTQYLSINKGRATETIENNTTMVKQNNYIITEKPRAGFSSVGDVINIKNSSNTIVAKAYVAGIKPLENEKMKLDIVIFDIIGDVNAGVKISSGPSSSGLVTLDAQIEKLRFDANNNSLLDFLPHSYAKKSLPRSIQVYKHYKGVTTSGGKIALSNEDDTEKFSPNIYDYEVYVKSAGNTMPESVEIKAGTADTAVSITIGNVNGAPAPVGRETIVVAKISSERPRIKSKVLKRSYKEVKTASSIVNGEIKLNQVDGYQLESVRLGPLTTDPNYTSKFNFDSGQRDTHYDVATISVKPGISIPNDVTLHITYSYFEHGQDGDYFAVDSYNELEYKLIPTYISDTGRRIFLGSVYDFRPTIRNGIPEKNISRGTNNQSFIALDERMVSDITYYLPRRDRIMITSNNALKTVVGEASFYPELPKELDDAITLYNLTILPYTFNINDVITEKKNHRRYTMRDIGYIENRLRTVEEVALLNKLESDTAATNFDDRFKSGYVVDNFSTSNTGDVDSPHWGVAYDLADPSIRPKAVSDFVEVELDESASTGIRYHEETGIITLDYTVKEFISQTLASDTVRVQPYMVHGWGKGNITIKPTIDIWKESYTHTENVYTSHVNVLDDIINKTTQTVSDASKATASDSVLRLQASSTK